MMDIVFFMSKMTWELIPLNKSEIDKSTLTPWKQNVVIVLVEVADESIG